MVLSWDKGPSEGKRQKVAKIERHLKSGTSINETARKLKCGVGTVHRIKVRMAKEAIAA